MAPGSDPLPTDAFEKDDPSNDAAFYGSPRFVTHIDEGAVEALTRFYRERLPARGAILDLMSSWVSHLPAEGAYSEVVGHGMNADELKANLRLTRFWTQDLNLNPRLPLEDLSFDAALCCVGVQYLQRPIETFKEVRRVLRPRGPFVVVFSNRCFPTKAVRIWLELNGRGRARLVSHYLETAGFGDLELAVLADGSYGDPLIAVVGHAPETNSVEGVANPALR